MNRANLKANDDYVKRLAAATGKSVEDIENQPLPNFWVSLKKFVCKSVWYGCGRAFDKVQRLKSTA